MRKIFIMGIILLSFFQAHLFAQNKIKFPDDFVIPEQMVPKDFMTEPLNDEARQAGVTQNPGIVRGTQFLEELYPDVDLTTIEALHLAMYVPRNDPDFELGIYTIAYRSAEDLQEEIKKTSMYAGSRYLYNGKYMVRVWGDSGSFGAEVNMLADYLKQKLNMQEFIPDIKEEDNTDTTEATSE